MDSRISSTSRPDIMLVESAPRPTPTPVRVSFSQVLAAGAQGLVQGAELAASQLPQSPMGAAAVRGGAHAMSVGGTPMALSSSSPEGPSGAAGPGPTSSAGASVLAPLTAGVTGMGTAAAGTPGVGGTDATGGIDASLQQSAQLSLYYLQIQQEVDSQNRSFTALSNVLKAEHDSAKAAIQNIHS